MPSFRRRTAVLLLAMFLSGLTLRVAVSSSVNNFFWYGGMVNDLQVAARNIADGRGFVHGERQSAAVRAYQAAHSVVVPVESVPVFEGDRYRPDVARLPVYPSIVALSYRLAGTDRLLELIQLVVDSAVALLVVLLAWGRFSPAVAYGSGFLYALWPPFARNARHDLAEAWIPLLLVLALFALVRASESRALRWFIFAGVFLGLLGYFRSEWLFFVPVAAAIVVLARREPRVLIGAGVMGLISLLVVAPWLARNYQIGGRPFMSATVGIVLWEGLGEFPNPWGAVPDDSAIETQMAELGLDDENDPQGVSAYYTGRFVSAVLQDPVFYASEVVRRFPKVFFAKTDWGFAEMNTRYPGFQELNSGGRSVSVLEFLRLNPVVFAAKTVPWALDIALVVAATFGLWVARRRGLVVWLLAAPPIFAMCLYSLTFFQARWLVPATLPYCVLASVAVEAGLRSLAMRRWPSRVSLRTQTTLDV